MKKMVIAGLLAAAASGAMADGAFDGVNAQLGMGFTSLGTEYSSNENNYTQPELYNNSTNVKGSQTGMLGNVALGYSYGINKQFNLAANVFYNFGSDNAGSLSGSDNSTSSSGTIQAKLKNIWGISVEPGYYFADKSLGFVKLGWAMASTSGSYNGSDADGSYSSSQSAGTANGFLYGIGFKQLVTDNIYVGIDAYQIAFSSKSVTTSDQYGTDTASYKPNMTYGGITVGYKF